VGRGVDGAAAHLALRCDAVPLVVVVVVPGTFSGAVSGFG
jgi:hypothetical protein